MRNRIIVMVGVVAAVALVAVLGYTWAWASTKSYDQHWSDCMDKKKAELYPQGHYFPDNAYNEAMRACENQAGVPTAQTTPLPAPKFDQ